MLLYLRAWAGTRSRTRIEATTKYRRLGRINGISGCTRKIVMIRHVVSAVLRQERIDHLITYLLGFDTCRGGKNESDVTIHFATNNQFETTSWILICLGNKGVARRIQILNH